MRALITDQNGNQSEVELVVPGLPEGQPLPDGAWGVKQEPDGTWILERIECPDELQDAVKATCTPVKARVET